MFLLCLCVCLRVGSVRLSQPRFYNILLDDEESHGRASPKDTNFFSSVTHLAVRLYICLCVYDDVCWLCASCAPVGQSYAATPSAQPLADTHVLW